VRAVAFSLDGRYIVSGGAGGYSHTFLHKIESSTPLFQSTPWGYEDETIDVSIDGRYIVAADSEMNAVRLYDTMDNTEPLWTYYADNKVRSVAILNPRSESVETATGSGIAILSSSSGSIESLVPVAEETLPTKGKPNAKFPYGFFSFNITGLEPHETVNLTITLPSSLPAGSHYWKYQNGNWFELPMGDNDGDETIIIQLTDGGLGDADGVANGKIVDVGGPGVPNIPVPWTLEQLAPWILLAVVIVAITIFAVVTYKRRKPLPPKTPPLS
jgi:WD40 repeat protein